MKKTILFLLIIPLSAFSLFAEKNYSSEKVVFLPQEFYVGDLVEMRVVIIPEPGVKVDKPEKFPDSYWVKIEDAEIFEVDEGYELRVFLRPYAPGIRTLPAIQFGDVLLRDIRIQTVSVLSSETLPLAPPAEQLMLPGTKYYIALVVGLVFLLPLFLIIFWTRLRRGIHAYVIERKQRRPYRRLMHVLAELRQDLHEMKGKDFYTRLIEELRIYLTARGSIDYVSATVREASAKILSDFYGIPDNDKLTILLKQGDEVKFGGKRVVASRREDDILLVQNAVSEIEEAAGGQRVDL
ncbi:MAG: hypothetical protein PQJ61_06035 [Spirochaetales bacterium]|uniref:Uncharacterized protein n=1 Tax=Candidatus Thalassospirochaeta sargassi TaxID=3119039 RepID=A0AAJ1IBT5_9SPIO|nr:hypothetical protein [Spirochaetales bacterium]